MKVSEKQLLIMLDLAKESLKVPVVFGGYDLQTRQQLVNDIMNQQSNELKEVESELSMEERFRKLAGKAKK